MQYCQDYLNEVEKITKSICLETTDKMIRSILEIKRKNGRLFFLGVGGSAANCSHAVNDFRKIAGIESYTPTDNVSELTARTNDDGWESTFVNYLKTSRLNSNDGIFILSVGGGNKEKNVSVNLIHALDYADEKRADILGIVGRDGGYTRKISDKCIVIPTLNNNTITPHAESWQAVIWHMLVTHPKIKINDGKWESLKP